MSHKILIVGGGYAGLLAALRLSHFVRKNTNVQVTLVNATDYFIERVRLHQLAAGNPPKKHSFAHLLRGTEVEFVQGYVTQIEAKQKRVTVQIDGDTQSMCYDTLLYALGSHTDKQVVPGIGDFAYTLDRVSAQKLAQGLPDAAAKGGKCVIVGGGLTGIEAATEIAEQYPQMQVALLTDGTFAEAFSKKGAAYLRQIFDELGIHVQDNVRVATVEADHIVLANEHQISYDVCIWAAGFAVPQLAQQAGIAVNCHGRIIIDGLMRSISHSDIFAAGDAAIFDEVSDLSQLRMACAVAMPMGGHVADNIAAHIRGDSLQPFNFGSGIWCISLGSQRALAQITGTDDQPKERIFTGRLGSFIKKFLLKYTIWMMYWERRIAGFYWWPKGMKAVTEVSRQQQGQSAWEV